MVSSICQGLQTCVEPWFPVSYFSRPNLAPPLSSFSKLPGMTDMSCVPQAVKDNLHYQEETNKMGSNDDDGGGDDHDDKAEDQNNGDKGGWSFLQALSNNIETTKNGNENDQVYVHPLGKRSSSALSVKSLEMCTESLGSETGSDGSQSCHDMSLLLPENHPKQISRTRMAKTLKRGACFPPPLTSLGGSRGVHVKPRRENGRLILEAVMVGPSNPCFHAERSEGRLRLRVSDNCTLDSDDDNEGEIDCKDDEFEQEFHAVNEDKETEVINENAVDNTGIETFTRPSNCRCKEGGHGNKRLENWEPFWVAT